MKRTVVILAGIAALGAGFVVANQLGAQAPAQPAAQQPAPAQCRVALVNLHLVLKGYAKTKVYDNEVEGIIKPMRDQGNKIKDDLKKYKDAFDHPQTTAEQKDQYSKAMVQYKRVLEDLEAEAGKKVGKKREEQLVQLYREIEAAVKGYAAANGFTVVLQYTEPGEESEKYSAQNIQRKLAGTSQTGCVSPMYFHPGTDISQAVITNLNSSYPSATPAAGGAAPAAPKGN